MKTLVLGMGNPILCDDRIGLRVVEELEGFLFDPDVTLQTSTLAGMSLLDCLIGFNRAILVDAIQTGGEPGTVYRLSPRDFITLHTFPHMHNIDFFQTLLLARGLVPDLPEEVVIIGVEVKDISNFGEDLTPEVERSVPLAVEQILQLLDHGNRSTSLLEPVACGVPEEATTPQKRRNGDVENSELRLDPRGAGDQAVSSPVSGPVSDQ